MKFNLLIILFLVLSAVAYAIYAKRTAISNSICSDKCKASISSKELTCKLTSPQLQERKATVIASLKSQIIDKKELPDGYAFKFAGADSVIDELTEFIKTERSCCDFFSFNLKVSGDKKEAWLELTGEERAKDFITSELEF